MSQSTGTDLVAGCLSVIVLGIGGIVFFWIGASIWEGVHNSTEATAWKCWNKDLGQWRIVKYESPEKPPSYLESKYINCEVFND